jgi:hypothetical protein
MNSSLSQFQRIDPLSIDGFIVALWRQQKLPNCRCILKAIQDGHLHLVEACRDDGKVTRAWQLCDGTGRVTVMTYMGGPPLLGASAEVVNRIVYGDIGWPLGADKLPSSNNIALVRGADDFLAAQYYWSHCADVSVVAMLGDVPIASDVITLLEGKNVVLGDLLDPALKAIFAIWRKQLKSVVGSLVRFTGGNGWSFADGRPARSLAELAMIEWEERLLADKARAATRTLTVDMQPVSAEAPLSLLTSLTGVQNCNICD